MTKYLFIVLALFVFACTEQPDPTKKELVARTWKVNSVKINTVTDTSVDYSTWKLTFKNDGTYSFVKGANTETGTWEINAAETDIVLDKGTSTERSYTLISVSGQKLDIETTYEATFKEPLKVYLYQLIPA